MERLGPGAIDRALTRAGFEELDHELNMGESLVDCPVCGETVKGSRISFHRSRSTLCRWRRAQDDVRSLWEVGWRDPFTVPDAPATWTALQAGAAWRRRVRTIEFPRWIAVLLSPPPLAG